MESMDFIDSGDRPSEAMMPFWDCYSDKPHPDFAKWVNTLGGIQYGWMMLYLVKEFPYLKENSNK